MKKKSKKWKYLVDNKLKGAYGETDFEKKTVRVNKKRHKGKLSKGFSKKEGSLINTMVHEDLHVKHPKMAEKKVRKVAKKKVEKMGAKAKAKLRAKFKKK